MKTSIREFAAVVQRLMAMGAKRETLVGSAYILSEQLAADIDVLVEVRDMDAYARALANEGWVVEGNAEYPVGSFVSLRKGDINVLVVADAAYFDRWVLAAEACKALKLADKNDRIRAHAVIRDGLKADDPTLP